MSELTLRTPFTNLNPSAAIRGLLEVIAKVVADLYGLVKTVLQQSFVQIAVGEWLDLKIREVGITRKTAVKTRGKLTSSTSTTTDLNDAGLHSVGYDSLLRNTSRYLICANLTNPLPDGDCRSSRYIPEGRAPGVIVRTCVPVDRRCSA